jgi:hypothetical protein
MSRQICYDTDVGETNGHLGGAALQTGNPLMPQWPDCLRGTEENPHVPAF